MRYYQVSRRDYRKNGTTRRDYKATRLEMDPSEVASVCGVIAKVIMWFGWAMIKSAAGRGNPYRLQTSLPAKRLR